ncbi:MAG TPA: hypothetical protein PLS49_00640 [Candidatus Woesebacteria bacterium]|nr:hypothetical protein [Candidatus Woesebacteria bacterium]
MNQFIKKNLTLILAFLIPILLIFVVAINAYFPFSSLKTTYNFVYATCDGYEYNYPAGCDIYAKSLYSVENNKLIVNTIDPAQDSDWDHTSDINEKYVVRLFLHSTAENESREITIDEAQQFEFSSLLTSPDGVTISNEYNSGSGLLLFDSGSSYGQYLKKGNIRSKLNLINGDRYYAQENFYFIGWVLK